MSGKNLTFKLVMNADTKGFVSNIKQSEDVTKKVFEAIKTEAKSIQVDALVEELGKATKEISNLGDKSTISANQLRDMSMQSQLMIGALSTELIKAQAELVELSRINATPTDIQNAVNRITELRSLIESVEVAFGIYEATASDAMVGVDRAASKTISEVQKFTSVDLTSLVSEAQSASRAIDSMGDGATISTKEVERIGELGANSISTLEQELLQATSELKALSQSTDAVPLDKFNQASQRVAALEDALTLTKTAFTDFQIKATTAMGGTADSADKAAESAKKAGNDIYSALGIKPPTVINDAISDLTKKLEDFKRNSKLPAEEIARVTLITEQQIEKLKSELRGVEPVVDDANSGISRLSKGVDGTKFAVNALAGALAALGVGLGIRELAQTADSYTNLSARINIATKEGGNFSSAMAGVHQVALATNTSLDATGSLFTRLNTVGKEMGMTQQQALDLTKTVTQAIQIGGGSAQASEAAVQQFIQAMQGGVLRGEEFNSIMENGYGVAEALAQGLGVTTGELRKMAENGELSSERVVKAIQSQAEQVQATYDQFPITITNALQKISTQWQILTGEMDQANGSSQAVANALSIIADNLGILKIFFDDAVEGVGWFQEKLSEVDPSTIEAIRSTLSAVYDTIKSVISSLMGIGETAWSAFTSVLDSISPLFNAILNGKNEVSGLTTLFNVFKIALGVASDAATGLNIALKLLLSGIQFISAGIHALSASVLDFLGFDDLAAQAQNASDALFRQAEKNTAEAKRLALESKGATKAAIEDIRKSEDEKNQERVSNSQKTIEQLKAQEEQHKTDYRAISDERIRAEQQFFEARKSGNQAAIDLALKGLTTTEAKERAYQAESQKLIDAKIQAAQDWVNAQQIAIDGTQKAVDVATKKTMQATLAALGLKLEFESTGKSIVTAMDQSVASVTNLDNKLAMGRKGAEALGLDLDVALNRISEGFSGKQKNLDDFIGSLELMGVKGKQAGDITYEAWLKWLDTAKSQAEIDFAKSKLKEFGDQGSLSTSQVEQGLIAIKLQTQKLPDDIDPVTEAFKRLSIETKENLKLAAQQALMDYITIRDSGKATAEGVQKAYEKAAQAAAVSGDAGVIASTNAANAGRNLEVQIDSTGKASVKAMDELTNSNEKVKDSAQRIGDGYRHAGRVAREEAESASDAWTAAIAKARDEWNKEMKRQGESLSNGIYNYDSYNKGEVVSRIESMGYSKDEAERLAGSIWSQAMSADRDAKSQSLGKAGNPALMKMIEQEFNNASAKGLTTQHGTNKVNELLRNLIGGSALASSRSKAPKPDYNEPAIASPNYKVPEATSKSVAYQISIGGENVTLYGDPGAEDSLEKMLAQLGTIKKRT